MNLLFGILIVFCVGVTYSSAGTLSSDAAHIEKPPAEVVQSPVDHKVQTPPTSTLLPVISTISTAASPSVKDGNVTEEITTKSPNVTVSKNVSTDAINTSVTSEDTPKIQNTTSSNNTTSTSIQTKPSQTTQKSTISTTIGTTTSTSAPVVSVADHAVPTPTTQERQFDGPSFVGGIVLTVGLTVIGFIAFKFFKSGKIERNYRTL